MTNNLSDEELIKLYSIESHPLSLGAQLCKRLSAVLRERDNAIAEREQAKNLIAFVGPALLVLRNMCRTTGLRLGEAKAQEMITAVQEYLNGPRAALQQEKE